MDSCRHLLDSELKDSEKETLEGYTSLCGYYYYCCYDYYYYYYGGGGGGGGGGLTGASVTACSACGQPTALPAVRLKGREGGKLRATHASLFA